MRGQIVGRLEMTVADKSVANVKAVYQDLTPNMPHEADLQTQLALFDQEIKARRDSVRPQGRDQGSAPLEQH